MKTKIFDLAWAGQSFCSSSSSFQDKVQWQLNDLIVCGESRQWPLNNERGNIYFTIHDINPK